MHALLAAVERGEEVTLTRYGNAVAVVVRPDLLRARQPSEVFAAARELGARIEAGRASALSASRGVSVERAEQLVAEVRAGRVGR